MQTAEKLNKTFSLMTENSSSKRKPNVINFYRTEKTPKVGDKIGDQNGPNAEQLRIKSPI